VFCGGVVAASACCLWPAFRHPSTIGHVFERWWSLPVGPWLGLCHRRGGFVGIVGGRCNARDVVFGDRGEQRCRA
jgi:hypothetical protein